MHQFLPHFLHVLNFCGRPIVQKFYFVKLFTRTFYNAEISDIQYSPSTFALCCEYSTLVLMYDDPQQTLNLHYEGNLQLTY